MEQDKTVAPLLCYPLAASSLGVWVWGIQNDCPERSGVVTCIRTPPPSSEAGQLSGLMQTDAQRAAKGATGLFLLWD